MKYSQLYNRIRHQPTRFGKVTKGVNKIFAKPKTKVKPKQDLRDVKEIKKLEYKLKLAEDKNKYRDKKLELATKMKRDIARYKARRYVYSLVKEQKSLRNQANRRVAKIKERMESGKPDSFGFRWT